MKPAVCPVCHHAHWLGEPHVFTAAAGGAVSLSAPLVKVPVVRGEDKDAVIAGLRKRVAELEADAVKSVKRREYQRKLMRKRRAKGSGEAEV